MIYSFSPKFIVMKKNLLITALLLPISVLLIWGEDMIQPPKVTSSLVAQIPHNLKHLMIENPHVEFLLLISKEGELLSKLATKSNHHSLIETAEKVIDRANFVAASKDGIMVPSRLKTTVHFRDIDQELWRATGVLPMGSNTMNGVDKKLYNRNRDHYSYRQSEINELDHPPQVINGSIVVLEDQNGNPCQGTAKVEYYIDRNGNAILPTILSSTNHVVGMSAIKTLERLKFEPLTRTGNPTYVIVKQTFNFDDHQDSKK